MSKFSYCKKCAQITFSKDKFEYSVVNHSPRQILKSGFGSFDEARAWSNGDISRHASRVEEKSVGELCSMCKTEK